MVLVNFNMLMCNANRGVDESADYLEEKEAMLQSIVSTYPSMQNGSSSPLPQPVPISGPSYSTCDICRICHCEAEVDAPLIAPCVCAGSLRYVHQACLQQWIKSSNTKKCELCKFEFIMHTKMKPLRQWERLQMTSMERRKIFCSVTFHFVAISCVVWSLYVLIDRTAEEVKAGVLEWPFWTKLIVVAIGFSGGLVFMYVQCKMYWHLCHRWKAYNRIIYVQNAPPKSSTTTASTNVVVSSTNLSHALINSSSLSSSLESTSTTTLTDVASKLAAADTCVVTMVTDTTTTMTVQSAHDPSIQVGQQETSISPPESHVPYDDVDEHSTTTKMPSKVHPHDDDDVEESATVISGSEVTMVEPIDRVT